MRNRAVLVVLLPTLVVAVACGYLWARGRVARAVSAGSGLPAARVWLLTVLGAVVGLVAGVAVGALTGRADGHRDLGPDMMDGTFVLVPGMLLGLAVGGGRALAIAAGHRQAHLERRRREQEAARAAEELARVRRQQVRDEQARRAGQLVGRALRRRRRDR